jgi:hypothetical protein
MWNLQIIASTGYHSARTKRETRSKNSDNETIQILVSYKHTWSVVTHSLQLKITVNRELHVCFSYCYMRICLLAVEH